MQRKAYGSVVVSAVAMALGVGLTGCSSGTAPSAETVDAKAGPATTTAAPGRYRTLFEPCGAVPQATLKDLLPGAAALSDAERDRTYRGTAAATFDTDRRVGCSWKADAPDATHRLTLDFERVVSYDPAVSDADRAQEVFGSKQSAAGIVAPPPTTTQTPATAPTPTGAPTGAPSGAATSALAGHEPSHGSTAPSAPSAPATPASPTTGLEPRTLDGLGEVAFVNDTLAAPGPSGAKRLVSVVFRTSNVIVTVAYEEQTTTSAEVPDSRELQEKARNLARLLAERLEE
ncbi:DUF3558 domain-containing protein [Streptomyces sp. SKN60]|uniref:DUF3558 domain-containing protein n=1 Tax=Streptomyces sp. SKN60 TaxID=2855506 RepID=UPI00224865F3|nr:DUF3558 domain-containing protein [Streptomyces sp. SKN60]MCX2183357.1 DUF3558 domain-containing protein [Streptomyces sp. SKN60]